MLEQLMNRKLVIMKYFHEYMELVQHNKIDIVLKLLINNLVSPDKFLNDDFMSPLSLACEMGHVEMAELLIKFGATVNPNSRTQVPPLYSAIHGGNDGLVRLLIEHGADLCASYGGYYVKGVYIISAQPLALALFLEHHSTAVAILNYQYSLEQVIKYRVKVGDEYKLYQVSVEELVVTNRYKISI